MSTTLDMFFHPSQGTWTLAGTLRNIVDANGNPIRIETKPASPFSGFPEFNNSDLSAWTQSNSAQATTIDANTTELDQLYIRLNSTSCDFVNATVNAPFINQSITGDFDIYTRVQWGDFRNFHGVGLMAQDTGTATTYAHTQAYINVGDGSSGPLQSAFTLTNSGTSSAETSNISQSAGNKRISESFWMRLKRSTNDFSAYYSVDGKNWTQIGTTRTLSMSSPAKVGLWGFNENTANAQAMWFDFARTWPPYDTGLPLASVILDSGKSGSTWTMSTFQDYFNEYEEFAPYAAIGFGSLKYDYGASDSSPPSLSGTYRTTSGMQGQSDPSGRYFKLSVQFNSPSGYELAKFDAAKIQAVTSWA